MTDLANRVGSCLVSHGERLGVPVRSSSPQARYSGEFYGQDGRGFPLPGAISGCFLIRLFERLPAGVTELGGHPGRGADLLTMYRAERETEVETLCAAAYEPPWRARTSGSARSPTCGAGRRQAHDDQRW